MNIIPLGATGTALLIIIGCTNASDMLGPAASALSAENHPFEVEAAVTRRIETSGHFDAIIEFPTLTLTPRGSNCLLQVEGQLVFTGTIEGAAIGQTSALVFASCADVGASPPGTYPDVFQSELAFDGTVDGEPARANVLYMGRVQPGGEIEGRLIFSNGVQGRLEVEAVVAVGGEYRGSVVVN